MKNTLEGHHSRLNETVDNTSDVEDSINGNHPIRRAKRTYIYSRTPATRTDGIHSPMTMTLN